MNIEELASFCRKRGFVYPTSSIYGGLKGFYDFGPLGTELKNNIKNLLWQKFVREKSNVIGLDGSIITNPMVWKASGHVDNFNDFLLECVNCKSLIRADTFLEDKYGIKFNDEDKIKVFLKENEVRCPNCGSRLEFKGSFNLMFKTEIGAGKNKIESYLRPETAQLIFINFKEIINSYKLKLPFGIAQLGKAFRNEISPRNFLFRMREFEQFEIEFFVDPKRINECEEFEEIKDEELLVFTREDQIKGKKEKIMKLKDLIAKGNKWQLYWLYQFYKFFIDLGISKEHLRIREHLKDELAHYANSCFDIEYKFPFGWKEVHGNADRGIFDLSQHKNYSKQNIEIYDSESKEKIIPYVASEPSQGIERAFLMFLFEAYEKGNDRIVLRLHKDLAPYQIAVLPLFNKPEFVIKAKEIFEVLNKNYRVMLDSSGSLLKRIKYHEEIGTYLIVILDYDTLEENTVVIKYRDKNFLKRIDIRNIKELEKSISK